MQVAVHRKDIYFRPDASRVIARFLYTSDERALNTIRSVLSMLENEVSISLKQVMNDYSLRHRNISKIFEKHFTKNIRLLSQLNIDPELLDISKKLLICS